MHTDVVAVHEVDGEHDGETTAEQREADHEARLKRAARLFALAAIRAAKARLSEGQVS